MRWPWARQRTAPRWLADAYIHAHVLAYIARDAVANPELRAAYRSALIAKARQLIESVEGADRDEVPVGGNVLRFERKK